MYEIPGLYLREKKFGTKIDSGITGFIPALIGRAIKGFLNTPVTITNWTEFERFYGGLHVDYMLGYEVKDFFDEGGKDCKIIRIAQASSSSVAGSIVASVTLKDALSVDTVIVSCINEGAWGNNITITVEDALNPTADNFKIVVKESGKIIGAYDGLVKDDDNARWLDAVINRYDEDGNIVNDGGSLYISVTSLELGDKPVNAISALTGGADGETPVTADYIGDEDSASGIYSLDTYRGFSSISVVEDHSPTMIQAGIEYCANRLDCVYIFAGEKTLSDVEIKSLALSLGTAAYNNTKELSDDVCASFGWMYHPWKVITDPIGKGLRPLKAISPEGSVAAKWNVSINNIGPWQAAAGSEFGVLVKAVKPERDSNKFLAEFNNIGVNIIRYFGDDVCVMGARTLSNDRDYRYCTTRNTLRVVQSEIGTINRPNVFKPNNSATYKLIDNNMEFVMNKYFKKGAFKGQTPDEGYFHKCDTDINTKETKDKGQIWAMGGIATVEPGEFLIFQIGLYIGGEIVFK